ncbi:MAG TPA: hypothetical protein VFR37_16710, partial [Longimicrobium sp.]|nr:hypothetical protein [Longimicrobium sp.]
MSETLKSVRPAKKPESAPAARHAPPAPVAAAAGPAAPAWAAATVSAPFALSLPVQRKPVIGRADDAYEREADAVAERVAAHGSVAAPLPISRVTTAALAPPVQRKSVGDRTAHDDPVRPDAGGPGVVQRQPSDDAGRDEDQPTGAVQTKPAVSAVVQRAEDEEKPEVDANAAVQTKPADSAIVQRAEDEA